MLTSHRKIFGLAFSIVIASILIFYKFNQIPSRTFFDEVEFARLALELGKRTPTIYMDYSTGHSTPYYYILLLSLQILGISSFALRLPSAVFGLLSVVFFYLTLYQIYKKILPKNELLILFMSISSTIILATSRWFYNFARYSFEATFLLFLEILSVFFFIKYLHHKKMLNLIASLAMAGLAFNSYAPGRLFILVIAASMFLAKKSLKFKFNPRHLFFSSAVFLIIIFPLVFYFVSNPDIRFQQQIYLQNSDLSIQEQASFFAENISKNLSMLVLQGDINGRHNYPGKPAITPFLLILFLLSIARVKIYRIKFWHAFFVIWAAVSIIPTLITYPWENPHMLRTFTVLPSIAYFSASSFFIIIKISARFSKNKSTHLAVAFIALLILLSAVYDARTYFKYQPAVFEMQFETVGDLSEANLNLLPKSMGR